MKKALLVLGARQYGPVFADVFDGVGGYRIAAFVENLDRSVCANPILDLPVRWIDDLDGLQASHAAICCLATSLRKGFVEQVAQRGFQFATLVHPRATVSARTSMGAGSSVDIGAIIAGFTEVGQHVRVGRGAMLGHHCKVGDFATLHPGANIAGRCVIGAQATIGLGATVLDGMEIGEGAFVAAGALVTRKVPPFALVAGSPAKVVCATYGPK